MNIKRHNIIFIVCFLLIFIIMGVLNYIADPYDLFNSEHTICPYKKPRSLIYIDLKMHKKALRKNDTLMIGGSETSTLFEQNPHFNVIGIEVLDYKNMYNLIKNYLTLVPDTKHINIIFSYGNFFKYDSSFDLPEFNRPNLTLKELFYILYSKDSLFYTYKVYSKEIKEKLRNSAYILKKKFSFLSEPEDEYDNDSSLFEIKIYPKFTGRFYNITKEDKIINENYNFLYLKKIAELLKQKNIDYKIIIVPYNAVYLGILDKKFPYKEMIYNLKKFAVDNCDNVYDFAFINKYTKANLLKDGYLYSNINHPNSLFGIKIYKVLYDPENAENDIFIKLNKDNFDAKMEYESKLLDNYINQNSDLLNYYNDLSNNFDINDQSFQITYKENEFPDYVYKELQYMKENQQLIK